MISELRKSVEVQQREICVRKVCTGIQELSSSAREPQYSPEVITLAGDETPELAKIVIEQVSLHQCQKPVHHFTACRHKCQPLLALRVPHSL